METANKGAPFNSFLFKRPEDEALYLRAYDAVFSSFHLKPEQIMVSTRFGLTHVNAFGSKDSPNLVLLHGMGASSTMWAANIEALSRHFRVYALDTIGDLGKSRCEGRLREGRDYAGWLKDTFDGLKLEKAHIAGVSYGGWIAFHFAVHAPERTRKIVSIAPAATFQRIRWSFFIRVLPIFLIPVKSIKNHFRTQFIRWLAGISDISVIEADPLWRQYLCGASLARLRPVPPPNIFDDRALKNITTPTLLLVGEKEVIYHPEKVLDRAGRTMPNIATELVPDGTHMMSWEKKETINAHMIDYLSN
ncbi:MAG: alpha/beta hydrolase [Deltaproteobacteria bacterium]|nr:alpha/beta hydrolase [Deltaproteobacteria bacterium]